MKALVLSGGGAHGAYEVGVLKRWMYEEGRDYDLIAGVSVGALNAAMLCQGKKGDPKGSWEAMNGYWARVSNKNIRKSWFFGAVSALWKPAVYNSKPLHDWVNQEMDLQKIQTSGRMVRVVSVSWDTGEPYVATEQDPDFKSWVIGSSSFPGMLLPVEIRGQRWTDGGVRSVTPLGAAIKAGCTDIDVVMCSDPELPSPFESKGKSVIPALAFRAISILSNEVARADFKIASLKNNIEGYRKINLTVVKPKVDLDQEFGSSMDFDSNLRGMMDMGYRDASLIQR